MANGINVDSNEMGALEIALEKEYMSYDFYKRAWALVENPEAKALLHKLSFEEQRHADKLLKRIAEVILRLPTEHMVSLNRAIEVFDLLATGGLENVG